MAVCRWHICAYIQGGGGGVGVGEGQDGVEGGRRPRGRVHTPYTIHLHLHIQLHIYIHIYIHIHKGEREYAPFFRCLERREPPRKNLKLAAARQDRIIISGPDKPLSGCIRAVLCFSFSLLIWYHRFDRVNIILGYLPSIDSLLGTLNWDVVNVNMKMV